jgi:putative photosynthetic complex assembly protein 2
MSEASTRRLPWAAFGRAAILVTLFWWLATGLIFMAQRRGTAATVGVAIATVLAIVGVWLVWRDRDRLDGVGATRSFLGGAAAWAWVSTVFLAGWIVGPADPSALGAKGSWELALEAIHATLYSDVVGLLVLAAVALATARGRNRVGLWTYMVFWGAQQSAKLNIFFGVENPGEAFFPPHLMFLTDYFGPHQNSWLIGVSIVALGWGAVWSGYHAFRAADLYNRVGRALLATLLGLAAFEHVVLALPLELPLWDVFLRWRGT